MPVAKRDENPDTKLEHEDSDSTICYDYIDQLKENTLNIYDEPVDVYPGSQVKTQEEKTPSKTVTPPPTSITESRKLTLRKRTQKMTIASSRKNENPGTKLEHDDSDCTICYDYIDQLNENTSNIHDEPVDVYPGPQVKTQEENALSKIVTPPPISITESRK